MLAEDAEWRGVAHGHLWWKRTPSCRGPDEAREVLRFQVERSGGRAPQVEPEFALVDDDRVIGSTIWRDAEGKRQERHQVLTLRDGKIADMRGFASKRQAERFARRR